ncbi:hypothetical protein HY639_04590 [Candidatus Woesearchaeota archaeon]|nr:hypothetical protein [Candidatus Woesearchaeota archaeon]
MNDDPILRNAERVRTGNWKMAHVEFINAQYVMHERFLKKLLDTPGGKEKIRELYGIKILKGYPSLV